MRMAPRSGCLAALNEGRGTHPGDTRIPARPLRCYPRSTKAGARTPATLREGIPDAPRIARSTKAGARTPATRSSRHHSSKLVSRSTKAGARTPATRALAPVGSTAARSLNEGRGTHPGDTSVSRVKPRGAQYRSTKAGARTPATPARTAGRHARRAALNEGRGTHPGDTRVTPQTYGRLCGAQRRPGHAPRRHSPTVPLREMHVDAQRRPGHAPRRHQPPGVVARRRIAALNEGRGTHPGDTANSTTRTETG